MKAAVRNLVTLSASTALMAHAAEIGEEEVNPQVADQLFENVVNECKGRFETSLALLHPADDPGRAIDDLSINVCLDFAHFLPRKYHKFVRHLKKRRQVKNRDPIRFKLSRMYWVS